MGGGSLSNQQLKEFDEYLSNSGVTQPTSDDVADEPVVQPKVATPSPRPAPAPTLRPAPVAVPDDDEEVEEPAPAPSPPPPAPEPEPAEPEPEPEPIAQPQSAYESYLDDIITLHEQKADDILDLLDRIDAKSHKDIVADLVDEMQYQKGVIRRERDQSDNLKQLLKLAADATKE